MTKEEFIPIYKNSKNNVVTVEGVSKVIVDYVEEVGTDKHKEHLQSLVAVINVAPMMVTNYFNYALMYYRNKFNLMELYNKDGSFMTCIN